VGVLLIGVWLEDRREKKKKAETEAASAALETGESPMDRTQP